MVAALDIATEMLLAFSAVMLVWSLQMKIGKKVTVVSAFGQRLILLIPIVLRLQCLDRAFKSHDPTLSITTSVICKQVEVIWAIISASVPCLRPFMLAVTTFYGAPTEGGFSRLDHYGIASGGSGGKSRRILETFRLKDMIPRPQTLDNGSLIGEPEAGQQREAGRSIKPSVNAHDPLNGIDAFPSYNSESAVQSGRQEDSVSLGSNDSKRMIIRKNTQIVVDTTIMSQ